MAETARIFTPTAAGPVVNTTIESITVNGSGDETPELIRRAVEESNELILDEIKRFTNTTIGAR